MFYPYFRGLLARTRFMEKFHFSFSAAIPLLIVSPISLFIVANGGSLLLSIVLILIAFLISTGISSKQSVGVWKKNQFIIDFLLFYLLP